MCSARSYRLHGLLIRVWSSDSSIKVILHDVLRYKGATVEDAAASADVDLHVRLVDMLPSLPESARHVHDHTYDITVHQALGKYYLTHSDAYVWLEPQAQRAHCCLRSGSEVSPRVIFYIIVLSLIVLLQHRDLFVLHAAALARDDFGVILSGQSGSGKTTTALNLVRQGWGYLSDDAVLLRQAKGQVEALSFREEFCISPDAVRHFPELGSYEWPRSLSNPAKWKIDVQQVYGSSRASACRPRVLLFPTVVEGPSVSQLGSMEAKEAILRLVGQSAMLFTRDQQVNATYMDLLRQLVLQASCYRLMLGDDALETPERVAELVEAA